MAEFYLFLKITLALLFLSSAFHKSAHFTEHVGTVKRYEVLPSKFSKLFALFDTGAQWVCGMLLLFGYLSSLSMVVYIIILSLYTYAITINLLKDRRDMSCGCGGAAGNHYISWMLVVRNAGLIVIALLTYFSLADIQDYRFFELFASSALFFKYTVTALISISVLMVFSILNNIVDVRNILNTILGGKHE